MDEKKADEQIIALLKQHEGNLQAEVAERQRQFQRALYVAGYRQGQADARVNLGEAVLTADILRNG